MARKDIFFASDFHLGAGNREAYRERELRIIRWLDQEVAPRAAALYLLGDTFDCWFEYRKVVPRGFTRFLGRLAELTGAGIPVYLFTGNHDMWMFGYLEEELGLEVIRRPLIREWSGKRFLLGHGDGLGPADHGYKRLKKILSHPAAQRAYSWLHPNFGLALAQHFSASSRKRKEGPAHFLGEQEEWLLQYCERKADLLGVDYFLFGHRHLPISYLLSNGSSRYINLGDWLQYFSYAVWDGKALGLHFFENEHGKFYSWD